MTPKPPNKKLKIIVLVIIVVAVLAALAFFFNSGSSPFSDMVVGPPPTDPQARIQWLSQNIDNMNHEKFIRLDYQVPSWKELDQLNLSLKTKNYPKFIKATQTYGTLPNLVEVLYFADVLKDLGVNTQFIHANYWLRGGKFKLWYTGYDKIFDLNQDQAKRALVHNILLAKQQGLAVILFPDYFQLENGGMTEHKISDDLESRLEIIALDLAQIAENYNVEYLVPSNQIEMILESNGYGIKEAQQRTNAFYASLVPKIKQIYSGKIMYKMGGFGDWQNYDGISLEGADIFGFTGCYNKNNHDLKFISDDIKLASAQASKLSQKYGIPWINAEFLVADQQNTYNRGRASQTYPLEKYYQAGLAAFDKTTASGFTVHSLLGSGKVYDTPAMPLIKDFFASKP